MLLDIKALHKSNEKFDFFVLVRNGWTFEFVLLIFLFTDLECLSVLRCYNTTSSHILQKRIHSSEEKIVSPNLDT